HPTKVYHVRPQAALLFFVPANELPCGHRVKAVCLGESNHIPRLKAEAFWPHFCHTSFVTPLLSHLFCHTSFGWGGHDGLFGLHDDRLQPWPHAVVCWRPNLATWPRAAGAHADNVSRDFTPSPSWALPPHSRMMGLRRHVLKHFPQDRCPADDVWDVQ